MLLMEILPKDPPWMLGSTFNLKPMGDIACIYLDFTYHHPPPSFTKLPRDYLMQTIKTAFMALNRTHPEATEACWRCLQLLTPLL